MKEFFKSKFFIVILLIAIVLTVVPSVLSIMGMGMYVRGAFNTVLTPVRSLFSAVTNAASGFTDYFTEFDRLQAENEELKAELRSLKEEIYSASELREQNDWLYQFLELKREHTDFVLEAADIIGRESGNYLTVFTVNRGTAHGIEKDMPVIDADGVVGYVKEVGINWAKVVSIIETASSVGAYVERSGQLALIEGDYAMMASGTCSMKYLPAGADIEIGDRIISSGIGSVYPRGLVIGYVQAITPDEYSQSLVATIKPSASLDDLSKVMIIKDYEVYTE